MVKEDAASRRSWQVASRFRPVQLEYAGGIKLNLLPGIEEATFYGERGKCASAAIDLRAFHDRLLRMCLLRSLRPYGKGPGMSLDPISRTGLMRYEESPN